MRLKYLFLTSTLCLIVFVFLYYLITNSFSLIQHSKLVKSAQITPTQDFAKSNSTSKCHARIINSIDQQAILPDPNCTPGVVNPNVTQDNLFQTICQKGYTKTIRPPASYTNKLKVLQIQEYGYQDLNLKSYEEDHLISLELGGSPDDPKNLWPEPHGSPNKKDLVENYLYKQICDGKITLKEAQILISGNWYNLYLGIRN
jgi:hypothetical protein